MELVKQKKAGRPPKPLEKHRLARLQMRTYPDVVEKVARVGTEAVEAAIRKIPEPPSINDRNGKNNERTI